MRCILLIFLLILMVVPVSGQVEWRHGRPDATLREMYKLRQPATEFVGFMLDGHMRESCRIVERDYRKEPETFLCVFEDRYRNVQTLYAETYERDIMLSLGDEVVAFSPVWHSRAYLIVVDIQPGEYTVYLHATYSHADRLEKMYTFEISDEISSDVLENPWCQAA